MKIYIIVPYILFFLSTQLYGQGCSDAGFCTMGAMRPDQFYNKDAAIKLRAIEINQYRGKTTLTPVVWVTTLDVTVGINTRNLIHVKLPYQRITGNLTDLQYNKPVGGLGDISISFTRKIVNSEKYDINATLGGKIPSNKADIDNANGADYHMYYQTSLGTYDLVSGISLISKKWLFATGYQLPLIHQNENDFRWNEWPEYHSPAYMELHNTHPAGMELKRGSDVMVRVERNFRFSNYSFNIGALPIYRITPDKAYDPVLDKTEVIEGTTGLAMSAVAGATYHFDINSSIKFLYGRKISQRNYNPDGLTRMSVLSFSYTYRF